MHLAGRVLAPVNEEISDALEEHITGGLASRCKVVNEAAIEQIADVEADFRACGTSTNRYLLATRKLCFRVRLRLIRVDGHGDVASINVELVVNNLRQPNRKKRHTIVIVQFGNVDSLRWDCEVPEHVPPRHVKDA